MGGDLMARPEWMAGREIKDATKAVTINIRKDHIEDALAGNGEKCVAGRCILQTLGATAVWVYRSKTYVVWDDDRPIQRYSNSSALVNRVIRILDDPTRDNKDIQPGLYDLRPPAPAQRLGVDRSPKKGSVKRKGHGGTHKSHRAIYGRMSASWQQGKSVV